MLLEASNLGVRFGGVAALHDFDWGVEEGEVRGLIGPNGSGKSTLFNLIIGRHKATSGFIRFGERRLDNLTPEKRARLGISIKFQTSNLFPELSATENVILGGIASRRLGVALRRRGESTSDLADAAETLAAVGLHHKRDELAANLAHGERAWLEIGMALATKPKLLLLDEPTSGMGPEETRRTVELIERIRSGVTVVVIEHDMDFVRAVAQTITVLYQGGLLTQGAYDDIRKDQRVIDAYLGKR